jgi:hypothetical protein
MKYTGYGVEDFHCQDRGRTTNIFKWISSKFKIDIDTVGQLLLNVETIERQANEQFKTLANAFGDLKITSTEVKYQKSTQRTNVYIPLFHISGEKTIPLWYNTSTLERFLRSESDFHREFRGKVYRASDVDITLSGEIKQLLQLQEKVEKINLVKGWREKRLKKSRSQDTNDNTESSDKEFPGTDEKESACKEPSLVFNTTDEQTKILNDIISDKLHRDAKDYKYCGRDRVLWGGMNRILNEGPLSTTNNTSKKSLTQAALLHSRNV